MKLMMRIDWVAGKCDGKHILDVGCAGNGRLGYRLHNKIVECADTVLGIDKDYKKMKKMISSGYNVLLGDAERFVGKHKRDVVVAAELIEHLKNVGLFLLCTRRNLRIGGLLIITTPNARHLETVLGCGIPDTHIQIYTHKLLSNVLELHGFRVVEKKFLLGTNIKFKKKPVTHKLYDNIFLRGFPRFAPHLGIVAKKVKLK